MHDRGDWLTPTVDGRPDFTKPPLLYWAMGASFALFGETFWAARLPVALAALALVWVDRPARPADLGPRGGAGGHPRPRDLPRAAPLRAAWTSWTCRWRWPSPSGSGACWRVADGAPMSLLLVTGLGRGAATLLKGPVGPLLMAAPWGGLPRSPPPPGARASLARRRRGAGAAPRRALVPGDGAPSRRAVRRPVLRHRERGEVPLPVDASRGSGAPARAPGAPAALDVPGPGARARGGAGLALGGGAAPPLQPARAEAPALRRAGARPPGGARERRSRRGQAGSRARRCSSPWGWPARWPCASPRRGCPPRARLRGGAARALGAGAGPRLGARGRGGLRRRRGAPLRQRAPGGGSGARAGVGGGARRVAPAVHRDAEPRPLLRSSWGGRCTARPERARCSVPSRRARRCW